MEGSAQAAPWEPQSLVHGGSSNVLNAKYMHMQHMARTARNPVYGGCAQQEDSVTRGSEAGSRCGSADDGTTHTGESAEERVADTASSTQHQRKTHASATRLLLQDFHISVSSGPLVPADDAPHDAPGRTPSRGPSRSRASPRRQQAEIPPDTSEQDEHAQGRPACGVAREKIQAGEAGGEANSSPPAICGSGSGVQPTSDLRGVVPPLLRRSPSPWDVGPVRSSSSLVPQRTTRQRSKSDDGGAARGNGPKSESPKRARFSQSPVRVPGPQTRGVEKFQSDY